MGAPEIDPDNFSRNHFILLKRLDFSLVYSLAWAMNSRGENGSIADVEGHTSLHLPQFVQAEKLIISLNENSGSSDDLSSLNMTGIGWEARYILTGAANE